MEPLEQPKAPRPRRFERLDRLFILVPLLLLSLDFIASPHLVESRFDSPELSVRQLLSDRSVNLGKYHLHSLRVSFARIEDYSTLDRTANALAVSVFPGKPEHIGQGPLTRVVRAGLPPAEDAQFMAFLAEPREPGTVQVFERERPHQEGPFSQIDYILVLRALPGKDPEALKALSNGLLEMLDQTKDKPISGLLLPCLTIRPNDPESPSFNDFFKPLFAALREASSPRHVNISFYERWSPAFRKSAVKSFNDHWRVESEDNYGFLSGLHRLEPRLLLLSLSLCLLFSSIHVFLNLKNFVILACAFSLTLLGSFKTLDWMTEWYGENNRAVFLIATAVIVAVGFPRFTRWNAKELFEPRSK